MDKIHLNLKSGWRTADCNSAISDNRKTLQFVLSEKLNRCWNREDKLLASVSTACSSKATATSGQSGGPSGRTLQEKATTNPSRQRELPVPAVSWICHDKIEKLNLIHFRLRKKTKQNMRPNTETDLNLVSVWISANQSLCWLEASFRQDERREEIKSSLCFSVI